MPTIDEYVQRLTNSTLKATEALQETAATIDALAAEHGTGGGNGEPEPPEPPEPGEVTFTFPNHTITAPGVIARYRIEPIHGRIVEASVSFDFQAGPWRADRPEGLHGVAQLAGAGKWEQECLFWHWYVRTAPSNYKARYKAPAIAGREATAEENLATPNTKVWYDLLRQPDGSYTGILNGLTLAGPLTVHPKEPLTLQLGTVDNPPPSKEVSWVGSTFSNIRVVLALEG